MNRCIPPIMPMVHRHIAEAAWLWSHFDMDRSSVLVEFSRLQHYQRLFSAHLDGLLACETMSLQLTKNQVYRWKTQDLFHVYFFLSLNMPDDFFETDIWSLLANNPKSNFFIDAAASAFVWLAKNKVSTAIQQLINRDDTISCCLALNAFGLRRELSQVDIAPLFTHKYPELRAEACRYTGRLRLFGMIPQLRQALADADPAVREQAAIALFLCNEPEAALSELLAAVRLHADTATAGEGAASIRSERRAQHLARLFGHAIPFPCSEAGAEALLKGLPSYLAILVLAHHGNPALIPQLIRFMDAETDPLAQGIYKRRALWALYFMLGINPENEGLLADSPSLSADWSRAPGLDQDTGLPEADAHKVRDWWHAHSARYLGATAPLLSGHEMASLATVRTLLENGMQAQRFAAALHACRLSDSAPWIDTRAPAAMQRQLWEQMQD